MSPLHLDAVAFSCVLLQRRYQYDFRFRRRCYRNENNFHICLIVRVQVPSTIVTIGNSMTCRDYKFMELSPHFKVICLHSKRLTGPGQKKHEIIMVICVTTISNSAGGFEFCAGLSQSRHMQRANVLDTFSSSRCRVRVYMCVCRHDNELLILIISR